MKRLIPRNSDPLRPAERPAPLTFPPGSLKDEQIMFLPPFLKKLSILVSYRFLEVLDQHQQEPAPM